MASKKILDRVTRHRLENQVIYTICNYLDKCDFDAIADENVLAFRYLVLNLIALRDDRKARGKLNELTKR